MVTWLPMCNAACLFMSLLKTSQISRQKAITSSFPEGKIKQNYYPPLAVIFQCWIIPRTFGRCMYLLGPLLCTSSLTHRGIK